MTKLDRLKLWVAEFGGEFTHVGLADEAWFKMPGMWALQLADKAKALGLRAEVYGISRNKSNSTILVWLS